MLFFAKNRAQAIEDYIESIRLIDQFEGRSGHRPIAGACRMLPQAKLATEYYKEDMNTEATELMRELILADEKQRTDFPTDTYGGHHRELRRSLGLVLDQFEKMNDRGVLD
jgi:hypothetical protein